MADPEHTDDLQGEIRVKVRIPCYRHKNRPAIARCCKCGVRLCRGCMRQVIETKQIACLNCARALNLKGHIACFRHDDRPAVAKCSNCNLPLCSECINRVYATNEIACPNCIYTLNMRANARMAVFRTKKQK